MYHTENTNRKVKMENTKKIRSDHNSLFNYFIYSKEYLSKAYIDKCERFIDDLGPKHKVADCFKMKKPK